MRLNSESISKLQDIFQERYGVELSEEDAQQAGLKIVRYVYAKELRKHSRNVQTKKQGL